jgi:hypothetical protein
LCIAAHFKLRHVVFIQRPKGPTILNGVNQGQMWSNGVNPVKWCQTELSGVKWSHRGVKRGQTGTNRDKLGQMWSKGVKQGQFRARFQGPIVPKSNGSILLKSDGPKVQ